MRDVVLVGDCRAQLETMPGGAAQCCVTSPPYFNLRTYGEQEEQIGNELELRDYVGALVEVMRGVRRVLADDGVLWLNLGDTYAGSGPKPSADCDPKDSKKGRDGQKGTRQVGVPAKNLLGVPWRVAFALQDDGWFLRQECIWAKGVSGDKRMGTAMPSPVSDRFVSAHEHVFMFTKQPRYFFDQGAVKEPLCTRIKERAYKGMSLMDYKGQKAQDASESKRRILEGQWKHTAGKDSAPTRSANAIFGDADQVARLNESGGIPRDVLMFKPSPSKEAHTAVFPPGLAEFFIKCSSRPGDVVLDPFMGSGTTAFAAKRLGRDYLGVELNPVFATAIECRLSPVMNQRLEATEAFA